jgi:hypothetical protein
VNVPFEDEDHSVYPVAVHIMILPNWALKNVSIIGRKSDDLWPRIIEITIFVLGP